MFCCKICVHPNLMTQCSYESSVQKLKNMLHYCVSSNNFKCTVAVKTGNQLANFFKDLYEAISHSQIHHFGDDANVLVCNK